MTCVPSVTSPLSRTSGILPVTGPPGRAPLRLPLPARHGSNFVVYMSEADNVYDPLYGSFVGDQGACMEHCQDVLHSASERGGEAALRGALSGAGPAVDVYGLQILDATLETGNTAEVEEDTAASALLLKHDRRRGRRCHAGHPGQGAAGAHAHHARQFSGALQQPELRGLGLRLEHRAHLHADVTPGRRYSFNYRHRLGTASNLAMYVSAADNDYAGVTGTFLGTPSQGVWSTARLDFSAPPGGIAKLHFGAFGGSIPGLVQQSAGTLDLYSMQIRASAFEGESVSVTDLLADLLALTGSATLDGLTAQGNVGCDQLLCNDVNCTDVFTTGVDASGAISCAALTATGTIAGAALTSTGAVSEHHRGGQRGPAELSHRNHGQHVDHQQHGQRRELPHGGRRVHGHADCLGRSNRGELRSHRHADHHRGGLRGPAGLREPGLHLHGHERRSVDGQRGLRRRDELGHGLRTAALRLQQPPMSPVSNTSACRGTPQSQPASDAAARRGVTCYVGSPLSLSPPKSPVSNTSARRGAGEESNLRNVAPETNALAMSPVAQDHREGLQNLVDPASSHMLVSKPFLKRSRARLLPGPPLITLRVNNGTG